MLSPRLRKRIRSQPLEEFVGFYAMRRVVRAGIHTTRLGQIGTQIARCGLIADFGFALIGAWNRVHIDVPVWAVFCAQATTYTPVFDHYFQRVPPPDGAYRTSHHAQRVAALTAGSRHQIFVISQPLTNQPRHTVVRVGAGARTLIATRTFLQIEYQQALRFHQPLRQEAIERHTYRGLETLLV